MARDRGKQLDRILRVRTLQLTLSRADEARALDKVASERALAGRIASLADAVAPAQELGSGFSLVAAAHFRSRLHQSAEAADHRVREATEQLQRATEATREAKRDQSAVEKLLARADADAALKAIRALEEAPPVRKIRHDPC
jgi:flagellar protein FliJ